MAQDVAHAQPPAPRSAPSCRAHRHLPRRLPGRRGAPPQRPQRAALRVVQLRFFEARCAVALLRKMPRKTDGFPDDALALLDALCALDAWPLAHDTLALLKAAVFERGLALIAARYAALGDHHGAAALLAPITRGPIATQAALDCLLATAPR